MKLTSTNRYHPLISILHWLMAFTFVFMIVSGEFMDDTLESELFHWHTQIGFTMLILIFLRLSSALLTHRTHNASLFSKNEERLACATKIGLYIVMFLIPFTGWLMTIFEPRLQPTEFLGLVNWPVLQSILSNHEQFEVLEEVHEVCVKALIGLTALHVAGYFKHLIVDKVNLLAVFRFKP